MAQTPRQKLGLRDQRRKSYKEVDEEEEHEQYQSSSIARLRTWRNDAPVLPPESAPNHVPVPDYVLPTPSPSPPCHSFVIILVILVTFVLYRLLTNLDLSDDPHNARKSN
jgi:hypothetical protein